MSEYSTTQSIEDRPATPAEIDNFCSENQIEGYTCTIRKKGGASGGRPKTVWSKHDETATVNEIAQFFGVGIYTWCFQWYDKNQKVMQKEMTIPLDGYFFEDLHNNYKKTKSLETVSNPSSGSKDGGEMFEKAFSLAREMVGKSDNGGNDRMIELMMTMQIESAKAQANATAESTKATMNMIVEMQKSSMQMFALILNLNNNKPQGVSEHDLMEKTFGYFERFSQMKEIASPTPPPPETTSDRLFAMVEKFFPIIMSVMALPKMVSKPIIEQTRETMESDETTAEDIRKLQEDSVTRDDLVQKCVLKFGKKATDQILDTLGLGKEYEEESEESNG